MTTPQIIARRLWLIFHLLIFVFQTVVDFYCHPSAMIPMKRAKCANKILQNQK
jgi:hypothetical protein